MISSSRTGLLVDRLPLCQRHLLTGSVAIPMNPSADRWLMIEMNPVASGTVTDPDQP